MFLTNLSYNKDLSSYDIMSEGYNIVLESERIWHKINMSMVRLEHTAIVNNDYSLLSEGENSWWGKIKAFFKKIWDAIAGFFKKVWNIIQSVVSKIMNFIFGKSNGKSKSEDKKIEIDKDKADAHKKNEQIIKDTQQLNKRVSDACNKIIKDNEIHKEKTEQLRKETNKILNELDELLKEETNNQSSKPKINVTVKDAKQIAKENADDLTNITRLCQSMQNDLEKKIKTTINSNNYELNSKEKTQAFQEIQSMVQQTSTKTVGTIAKRTVKLSKELAEMIRTDGDGGAYKEYSDPNFNHPKHFTELDGMVPPIIKEQIKDYIKHTGKVHRGDITVKEAVFEELNRKCDNYELTFDKMNHIYAKARHEYYDQDLYYYLIRTQNK